jgi:hypothetical protein
MHYNRGVEETAAFLGVQPIMLPSAPHDVMLAEDWPLGAQRLLSWLEEQDFSSSGSR